MLSVQVYVLRLPKAGVRPEGMLQLPASLISDHHARAGPRSNHDKVTWCDVASQPTRLQKLQHDASSPTSPTMLRCLEQRETKVHLF
jgi:hypothetical protein